MNRIHVINTEIVNLSIQETLALVQEKLNEANNVAVNAGKIVAMQKLAIMRKRKPQRTN